MKLKLLYILPVLVALSSCVKKSIAPTPTNPPSGTFTGTFTSLHLNSTTKKVDTLTANIQLNMETSTGFKLTGDTTTVIAGSYGSYDVGANNYINFIDKTYPATGTPTKAHLNGVYQYAYDGSVFQLLASSVDTLTVFYNLKKTSN